MKTRSHVNDIKEKTASAINKRPLLDEKYHRNIAHAAALLVQAGRGAWRYGGQFTAGATLWLSNSNEETTIIKPLESNTNGTTAT